MPNYKMDFINGDNANDGSTWALAFKNFAAKAFSPGDTIDVAMCPETAQAGTGTATNGSLSVTGISGWTPVAYNVIRFVGDDTLYSIRTYSAGTITLYRPYEGTTGEKTINLLTLPMISASADVRPTASGTIGNNIVFNGGVNPANDLREGFTIINLNNVNNAWLNNKSYLTFNYFGAYYTYACYMYNYNTYNNYYMFKPGSSGSFIGGLLTTVNDLVVENVNVILNANYCEINDPYFAQYGYNGLDSGSSKRTVINNPKFYLGANYAAFYLTGNIMNVNINNLNMLNACLGVFWPYSWVSSYYVYNLVFYCPQVNENALVYYNSSGFCGRVAFINVDGIPNDDYLFLENRGSAADKYTEMTPDSDIYHTSAPSAKMAFKADMYPITHGPFYFPCEAGVAKTISVWVRKNSDYDVNYLPSMRVKWPTGASGSVVMNDHVVTMTDVDDTWEQLSYTVTPSVKGAIIVELTFCGNHASALAWYDDFGAV